MVGMLRNAEKPAVDHQEAVQVLSLDDVADEVGGIPDEIRGWIENGEIALADADAARADRICEDDFRRIERHQIAVDIRRCFKEPERFLDTMFERFGNKTPGELLDGGDSDLVRDLVWQVKSGAN